MQGGRPCNGSDQAEFRPLEFTWLRGRRTDGRIQTGHDVMEGLIDGLERVRLPGEGVLIDALVGGSGPPLLLLHGFPQTRLTWKAVAPHLLDQFTLVIPDLRGYGRSDKPYGDPAHHAYSKRVMARDQIAVMQGLGFTRFNVAGHDRGGRVAYRMALDAPECVEKLAVLDIIPTRDAWQATGDAAMNLFHWTFLAQPDELPEMLLRERSREFVLWLMRRWAAEGFHFDRTALEDYLECGTTIAGFHAACEDYRAGASVDCACDDADHGAGNKLRMPLLVLWGERAAVNKANPLDVWRRWADDVVGFSAPCGHFVPEEAVDFTVNAFRDFFGGGAAASLHM